MNNLFLIYKIILITILIINIDNKDINKSNNNRIQFEKGKTYFLFCIGLIGSGKSSFFKEVYSFLNTKEKKEKFNTFLFPSDIIKTEVVERLKNIPNFDLEDLHNIISEIADIELYKKIDKCLNNLDKNKINILLIDENIPNGIDIFVEKYLINKTIQNFVVIVPNITRPIIIDDLKYPWSMNYFIQCYFRLKNRKDHTLLNGDNPLSTIIYLRYLKRSENFDFYRDIKKKIDIKPFRQEYLKDKKLKNIKKLFQKFKQENNEKNIFIQKIDLTDESKIIKIGSDTKYFFKNVVTKLSDKITGKVVKEKYGKEINQYFGLLEKKYKKNDFNNCSNIVREEIKDLFENGINES